MHIMKTKKEEGKKERRKEGMMRKPKKNCEEQVEEKGRK